MFCVYLLESVKKQSKTYVGLTTKLSTTRLEEHNNGKSKFTKAYIPWKLIYYENFYCKLCAAKREKYFKSGIGFKFRKILITHYKELR